MQHTTNNVTESPFALAISNIAVLAEISSNKQDLLSKYLKKVNFVREMQLK